MVQRIHGSVLCVSSDVCNYFVAYASTGVYVVMCMVLYMHCAYMVYRARAEDVVKKPTNITFEEAASIPLAGMTAYQVLKSLKGGEKVFLILLIM